MTKKHHTLSLILAVMLVFAVLAGFQPLLAEAKAEAEAEAEAEVVADNEPTEETQETETEATPAPAEDVVALTEAASTNDTVLLNGVEIWSGEVPEENYIPLTPIAWALGYYIQEKPTGEAQIHLVALGELSDSPLDNMIFITTDPAQLEPYDAPAVMILGEGFLRENQRVPFQAPPILQGGELYVGLDDILTIFEAEITIENRVIAVESEDFNLYTASQWIPQEYTFDQWAELQMNYRDDQGVRIVSLTEPIYNPDMLAANVIEYATLTQGEGLAKPETIEEKLGIAAQVVANNDPESAGTEIAIEDLLTQVDFFFGLDRYDLEELPETWTLPEAQEQVDVEVLGYEAIDDLNYTVTYVHTATGVTEVASVHPAINWKSDVREVFLALDEISVVTE